MCIVACVAVLAACGELWSVKTVPSPASPHAVYSCAVSTARDLGYTRLVVDSSDTTHPTLEAHKPLPQAAKGPDATEVSREDLLMVRADPAGSGSKVRVTAGTTSLHETRRGPTTESEPANYAARAAADTVIARCQSVGTS